MNKPCHQAEERVLPACQDWMVLLKLMDTEPLALAALKGKYDKYYISKYKYFFFNFFTVDY